MRIEIAEVQLWQYIGFERIVKLSLITSPYSSGTDRVFARPSAALRALSSVIFWFIPWVRIASPSRSRAFVDPRASSYHERHDGNRQ